MFGRPAFGSQPNTFGFGSNNQPAFGQSNQLFGATGTSTFGSNTTGGFGSTPQPMFGGTPSSGTSLFGQTNTSTFGQSAPQPGFGSSLFGSTAQVSSSGIFGSTNTLSFGQQNKPTGFGFPSNTGTGLFSQNTQQPQQSTSGFQGSSTGGLFGSTGSSFAANSSQMGTIIKFVPITGTDSVQKSGIVQSINTKHHCITCMKDYENKSLEELRWEDYQCNRKGPQQSGFGAPQSGFGIASTSSSIFGQQDKPAFRSQRTDFGTPGFGMSTQTTAPNIFAKPSTGFGVNTTSSFSFGTNTSSTGLFGSNASTSAFGTPSNQLFGQQQQQPQQQSGFGSVFGQGNTPATSGLFGKPASSTGFGTAAQAGFNYPTQSRSQTSLFGQTSKPNTGFGTGLFGQTTSQAPTFGQQQQQTFGGFGTTAFGKPMQPTFGQTSQPTFGTTQQTGLFGTTQNKPLFGSGSTGGGLFGNNNFQQTNSFQFPSQPQQQQQQQQQQQHPPANQSLDSISQDLRQLVQITDPYGYNKHLEGLSPIKPTSANYVTNPKDLQKLLESPPPPVAVISPMNKRLKVFPVSTKKTNLFDEVLEKETTIANYNLRNASKRLVFSKEMKLQLEASHIDELSQDDVIDIIEKQPKFAFNKPTISKSTATHESIGLPESPSSDRMHGVSFNAPETISSERMHRTPVKQPESASSRRELTIRVSPSVAEMNASPFKIDTGAGGDVPVSVGVATAATKDVPPVNDVPSPPANRDSIREERIGDAPTAIDTCGVVLTRPEYYTIPPLEKLIEHMQPDGKCLVKGFTVGRVGYGNVSFPDLMDVANLNLDELVHFRYREVTIYPDDSKKPPQGHGLNRRAQVTLDKVYPKAKIDRKLITDFETLMSINFAETLRGLCERHGTKFLDYRPETGSWVFVVDHFSKYGFEDSDEEEIPAKVPSQKNCQTVEHKRLHRNRLKDYPHKDLIVNKMMMRKTNEMNGMEFEIDDFRNSTARDKHHEHHCSGDDEYLVDEVMIDEEDEIEIEEDDDDAPYTTGKASIESLDFDYSSILATSKSIHHVESRKKLYSVPTGDVYFMKSSLYDENFEPTDIERDNIESLTVRGNLFRDFRPTFTKQIKQKVEKPVLQQQVIPKRERILPKVFTLQNKKCTVAAVDSIYNNRNYMDIAVFKGRSFKVGWSRGMAMFAPLQKETGNAGTVIKIMNSFDTSSFEPFKDKLGQHLNVVLDTSDIILQDGVPLFKIRNGKKALLRHQLLARETSTDNVGDEYVDYYQQVWDLCAAFWGPMSRPTNRRDLFSTWMECAVDKTVHEAIIEMDSCVAPGQLFKKIFILLTGHRVTEAAKLASENGLFNMSLLLSQLNCSDATKATMRTQMEQWNKSTAIEHICGEAQKIYMLIAGLTIDGGVKRVSEYVNVCTELDWKRSLAIMLWYMVPSSANISVALEMYKRGFDEDNFAAKPTPEFNERKDIFDLRYHLMLLHIGQGKPLETVLHPETHSKYTTDYRLSWLLLQTLEALNVGTIGETAKTLMATSFSQQLENMGMYNWAIFVLLFVDEPLLRKNYVMAVMHRNLTLGDTSRLIEDEMAADFCIPPEWLHEVKAYRTNALCMHWEAYKHFAYTNNWISSHDVAIKKVIPQLLVNQDLELVSEVLREIEPGCRNMPNWNLEGGLILMFMDLHEKFQEKRKFKKEEAMAIHSLLLKICTEITNFPVKEPIQVAAISQISKHCIVYFRILLNQLRSSYKGIFDTTITQIDELIMPPDYKFGELQCDVDYFLMNSNERNKAYLQL